MKKRKTSEFKLTVSHYKILQTVNELNKVNDKKGYILLTYKNMAIDIAKTDGKVIKNNYPKGLRKKF